MNPGTIMRHIRATTKESLHQDYTATTFRKDTFCFSTHSCHYLTIKLHNNNKPHPTINHGEQGVSHLWFPHPSPLSRRLLLFSFLCITKIPRIAYAAIYHEHVGNCIINRGLSSIFFTRPSQGWEGEHVWGVGVENLWVFVFGREMRKRERWGRMDVEGIWRLVCVVFFRMMSDFEMGALNAIGEMCTWEHDGSVRRRWIWAENSDWTEAEREYRINGISYKSCSLYTILLLDAEHPLLQAHSQFRASSSFDTVKRFLLFSILATECTHYRIPKKKRGVIYIFA